MNRRAMLVGLGGVLAIGATVKASALPADEHTYKGHRIRWAGWRNSPQQYCDFGFWVAHRPGLTKWGDRPAFVYATTLGVCDIAADCEVLDTSISRGWRVSPMPEPHERDELKARALRLLYDHLS